MPVATLEAFRDHGKLRNTLQDNVAEAVYLADRVIVLSPHPGTVKAEVKITLPRPRDALSVPFLEYQRVIVSHLGGR